MDTLVVPADPQEPVRVIDLNADGDQLKNLQREVGGLIDIVGHRECDLVINDEGRINDSPVNVRVTHWVLQDSTLAKEGRAYECSVIYGDVVITGPPQGGESTEVSPALVNYFSSLRLSRNAVDDWTTREVGWTVTEWNLDRPSADRPDLGRDEGFGLGL